MFISMYLLRPHKGWKIGRACNIFELVGRIDQGGMRQARG